MPFIQIYTVYVTSYNNEGELEERLYSNDYWENFDSVFELKRSLQQLDWAVNTRIDSKEVWRD